MKNLYIFSLLLMLFFPISCSIQEIESLRFSTNKKLLKQLFEENKNVFEIRSPEGNVSYVWTYSKDKIFIYHLSNGKINNIEGYLLNKPDWLLQDRVSDYRLRDCIATDGGILIFLIQGNTDFVEEEIPILLSCLQKTNFKSDFYKNLQSDINKYNISWYNK